MIRGRSKVDLPACCSGNTSQSNFMHLYNKVDIVWGFQNFLLHPFGYSNRIHWWKIFSSYIYENAQVQFIDSFENIDYQVNHSGYEIKITTYTWWSHSLLCTFSTTSLERISISTIYTFDYWISHWRPWPAQSKSNKTTKYINSRHSRKSQLELWIVTLSVAYP